jgi:hypothetical protein
MKDNVCATRGRFKLLPALRLASLPIEDERRARKEEIWEVPPQTREVHEKTAT